MRPEIPTADQVYCAKRSSDIHRRLRVRRKRCVFVVAQSSKAAYVLQSHYTAGERSERLSCYYCGVSNFVKTLANYPLCFKKILLLQRHVAPAHYGL